jgi:hypothetical protein
MTTTTRRHRLQHHAPQHRPSPHHPLVERLLALWAEPIPDVQAARAAFAGLYADPFRLNGVSVPLDALVDRATATHAALHRTGVVVLDVVEAPGRVVVAFEMTATHIGTLHTSIGDVAATGRTVTVRTIDILTVAGGLITEIQVVSDELGLLDQLGVRVGGGLS